MRPTPILIALMTAAPALAQAAPARLSEPAVRAFLARQSKAWNAGDLRAYFALFTAKATFTDRGRAKDGRVVPYGESTLAEARRQSRKTLAASKVKETTALRSIAIAPDGESARVEASEVTLITEKGRTRRICGDRRQTIVATVHGPRSTGQVDTIFECR